jgi:hypothetical protein
MEVLSNPHVTRLSVRRYIVRNSCCVEGFYSGKYLEEDPETMKRSSLVIAISVVLLNTLLWSQTTAQTNATANGRASASAGNHDLSSGVSSSTSGSAHSNGTNYGLEAGTGFNAALVTSVDSKRAKSGDGSAARTTENVRAEGKTVLPKGTKLIGHITRASARAKGDTESALGIAFDRAILKGGTQIPLNLAIQALASSRAMASSSRDDLDMTADAGAGMNASGAVRGGGLLRGANSAVSSTVGASTNTASQVGARGEGALNSTVQSATGLPGSSPSVGGLAASGQLSSNSRGVFNLNGLSLNSAVSNQMRDSVVTSVGKSAHLDGGTRMLLVTQAAASGSAESTK